MIWSTRFKHFLFNVCPLQYQFHEDLPDDSVPLPHLGGSLSTYNQKDPLFLMKLTNRCDQLRCTR